MLRCRRFRPRASQTTAGGQTLLRIRNRAKIRVSYLNTGTRTVEDVNYRFTGTNQPYDVVPAPLSRRCHRLSVTCSSVVVFSRESSVPWQQAVKGKHIVLKGRGTPGELSAELLPPRHHMVGAAAAGPETVFPFVVPTRSDLTEFEGPVVLPISGSPKDQRGLWLRLHSIPKGAATLRGAVLHCSKELAMALAGQQHIVQVSRGWGGRNLRGDRAWQVRQGQKTSGRLAGDGSRVRHSPPLWHLPFSSQLTPPSYSNA